MSSERFHKAARDGLLDVLKEATRKDVNSKDADGMTPVLWAAFEGRLDALRLLVGRGGDPDKSDQFGNTALHLSAAKGHLHCVDFLVKFGVNLYSLDIDKHSAKDLAAINNREEILRHLDSAMGNLEMKDRKKAKALKELAEKTCEKRIKEYTKRQQKLDQEYESMKSGSHRPSTVLAAIKHKIWSSSQGNLLKQLHKDQLSTNTTQKFSDFVGGSTVSSKREFVQKKANAMKVRQHLNGGPDLASENSFKIGEIESNGKRTITSLMGLQRDSEVLYVGTFSDNGGSESGKRGKIEDIFDVDREGAINSDIEQDISKEGCGTLSRSFSQPDFLAVPNTNDDLSLGIKFQRPSALFDRPVLGSLAFRRSVTAALGQFQPEASSMVSSASTIDSRKNGLLQKIRGKQRSFLTISDSDTDAETESDDQEDNGSPLQRFLAVWGLEEYLQIFQKQQIDLDTLMLLTESDLKSLGLPLGPFRKLVIAIQERRHALANPGVISDSRL